MGIEEEKKGGIVFKRDRIAIANKILQEKTKSELLPMRTSRGSSNIQILVGTLEDQIHHFNSAVQLFGRNVNRSMTPYNYETWQQKFVQEIILKYQPILKYIHDYNLYSYVNSSSAKIQAIQYSLEQLSRKLTAKTIRFEYEPIKRNVQKNILNIGLQLDTFQRAIQNSMISQMSTRRTPAQKAA